MPEAALDNWQPVWNAQLSISTPVCVNFELRPGAGDIHICWFNFDALAQGNAYKPTKEPINYRGPGGDRTHDLQTEATPPAASCQLSSTYASRHWNCVKKRNSNDMPEAALDNWQLVWNAQVSISTPVCVNFELRPGAGDIHICWFNFDALAQGNAYKPTKEPINYRGPGGDRTHDLQTEATPPAASCPAYAHLHRDPTETYAYMVPHTYMYIYTYKRLCIYTHIHTWRSWLWEHSFFIILLNVSDHHIESETQHCCNNRRCLMNDPMEEMGFILDKIKFYIWGLIYVIGCWSLEIDLKETDNLFFVVCRVS